MKQFLLDLIEYIIDILLNRERHEIVEKDDEPIINEIEIPKEEPNEVATPDTSEKEPIIEEKPQEPIIEQEEPKQPEKLIENASNEPYKMLSLKERQTYMKKIGLYKKSIDGIVGKGHKNGVRQLNVIFLNKNVETYFEESDKILRIMYASYCESPYMKDSDWQYFKNFKKSEFKCKCKGKGCNGYPSKIQIKLLMLVQYIRNRLSKAYKFTSALRCELHNKNVGGVSNSKHKIGGATDGYASNTTAKTIMNIAKETTLLNYTYQCGDVEVHTDTKL